MQTEATNTIQAVQTRILGNKHFATRLRTELLSVRGRAKQGYKPTDTFRRILDNLSDDQLISKHLSHEIIKKMPLEAVRHFD